MEKKLTFNEQAKRYDDLRPIYPDTMYTDLIHYANLNESSNLLEIGIGTGQATKPLLDKNYTITAIEIGDKLAKYTQNKYSDYNNLTVITSDFESVQLKEKYNLIYSASAFHWIDPDLGVSKVYDLLEEHGVFSYISITPFPHHISYPLFEDLQQVYKEYGKYFGNKVIEATVNNLQKMVTSKIKYRTDLLSKYNFNNIQSNTYTYQKDFTSESYIELISTYSDHASIPDEDRYPFFDKIKQKIELHGGIMSLEYTVVVVSGTK